MPPTRKIASHADLPDNIMLIVGQLLEATKAASEGLKSMSMEVQSNAKAIITASKTLEMVETRLAEVDDMVRDVTNAGNLMSVTKTLTADLTSVHATIKQLRDDVDVMKSDLGRLGATAASVRSSIKSSRAIAWTVIQFAAWIATTGIAVWAATNGK